MKFGIVGAGAMGCLFGSFLAKVHKDVWLLDVWQEHISQINARGLTVLNKGSIETIPINATTDSHGIGVCDVVMIFTKYRHTREAIQDALNLIDDNSVVITVQNGIGNVDIISEFVNRRQVILGLTILGSAIKGPGTIEITVSEESPTYVWPAEGEVSDRIQEIVAAFNAAGLNFQLSPNVQEQIWRKLCLNAGLSILLALTRLNCGNFISQPSSLDLIRRLVFEIVSVGNKEGVMLEPEETYEYVVSLARQSPEHRSSALMDILNGRKTEIDSLNGAIVDKAKVHGIDVPCNVMVTHLIRIIENTYNQAIQYP